MKLNGASGVAGEAARPVRQSLDPTAGASGPELVHKEGPQPLPTNTPSPNRTTVRHSPVLTPRRLEVDPTLKNAPPMPPPAPSGCGR